MGKVKLAQSLARAGLHLAVSTVGRIRNEPVPTPSSDGPVLGDTPLSMPPTTETSDGLHHSDTAMSLRRAIAKRSNHVWHVDLTAVPIAGGFWVPWLPFALPQCWPFCWWTAIVLDHYSRRVMGFGVFKIQPSSKKVRCFLDRAIAAAGTAPKHLITDSGTQFTCDDFGPWCKNHGIRHRKGAVGQSGSIAVIERFMLTLKDGCTRLLSVVPLLHTAFRRELSLFVDWYNRDRPHMTLSGATPNEVYFHLRRANREPRFEPRPGWPRASPCARPRTLVKGQPGVLLDMHVVFVANRRHLPRVTLTRAA